MNTLRSRLLLPLEGASILLMFSQAFASPAACWRDDLSMFKEADIVVAGEVVTSRRWLEGAATHHLVAKYRIVDVFKGDIDSGGVVIVTDTCLDTPPPRHYEGYPAMENYCMDGAHLSLTGIDIGSGKPPGAPTKVWNLFLRSDRRTGAPQQTWLEVNRTGYGGGCGYTLEDLAPEERNGFEQMRKRTGTGQQPGQGEQR